MSTNDENIVKVDEDQHPFDYLSPQYYTFFITYLETGNATKSAIKAGYSEQSATTQGWRLLKHADILKAFDWEKARIRSHYHRTHEAAASYYMRVMNLEVSDFFTTIGRGSKKKLVLNEDNFRLYGKFIQKIKQGKDGAIEITLFSKDTAAEMLNKHTGFYKEDNEQRKNEGPTIVLPHNERDDLPV